MKRYIIFLVLAVSLTYLPSLDNGFVFWDDDTHVYRNPAIRALDARHLQVIFTTVVNKTYIPLTTLSFALEYHFFKDQPFIYHLDNLLLHIAVTLLVFYFALLCRLPSLPAFIAALIFGIHPMHVESVAWITERKDVLCAFFYMAALCGYCRYLSLVRAGDKTAWWMFPSIVFLAVLSALAKPMALSLPPVLFLMDWYFDRRFSRESFLQKVYLAIFLMPVVWATYFLNAGLMGLRSLQSVLIIIWAFVFYHRNFFIPDTYTLFSATPLSLPLSHPAYWGSCLMVLAAGIMLVRFRRNKLALLAVLFNLLTIFPLLRLADQGVVAARFMYIPSVGWCLLLGNLWASVYSCLQRRVPRIIWSLLLAGAMSFLAVRSVVHIEVWQDTRRLWEHQVRHEPRAHGGISHSHLAWAYLSGENFSADDPAMVTRIEGLLMRALALKPSCGTCYWGLAELYYRLRDFDRAETCYGKARELQKDNAEILFGLGRLYYVVGQPDKGWAAFKKIMEIRPRHVLMYNVIKEFYRSHPGQTGTDLQSFMELYGANELPER